MESKSGEGLECIAEDEEHAEEEVSEVTGPITDDATTEDETADHTQTSDDEGNKLPYLILYVTVVLLYFLIPCIKIKLVKF